jgi:hypothetical protein
VESGRSSRKFRRSVLFESSVLNNKSYTAYCPFLVTRLVYSSTQKMEVTRSIELLVNYQITRCHVQENSILQKYINFMPINRCVSKGTAAFNALQGHLENVTCISAIEVYRFCF